MADLKSKYGALELAAKAAGLLAFGAFAVHEAIRAYELLMAGAGGEADVNWQRLALNVSNFLYLALIVVVYARRPKASGKARGVLPRLLGPVGTFGLPVALFFLYRSPPSWALVAGPALLVAGHVLAFVVLSWLGRGFSIMAEARVLVTSGPYAVVRHPLYLAEEVAAVGLFLQWFTLPALGVLLAHLAVQLLRMRNEERVLAGAFPEYAPYRARTKAFLPYLI